MAPNYINLIIVVLANFPLLPFPNNPNTLKHYIMFSKVSQIKITWNLNRKLVFFSLVIKILINNFKGKLKIQFWLSG